MAIEDLPHPVHPFREIPALEETLGSGLEFKRVDNWSEERPTDGDVYLLYGRYDGALYVFECVDVDDKLLPNYFPHDFEENPRGGLVSELVERKQIAHRAPGIISFTKRNVNLLYRSGSQTIRPSSLFEDIEKAHFTDLALHTIENRLQREYETFFNRPDAVEQLGVLAMYLDQTAQLYPESSPQRQRLKITAGVLNELIISLSSQTESFGPFGSIS